MIRLTVNGSTKNFPRPMLVVELLQCMGVERKKIAVERNGEIVPRSVYGATQLADGDRLEIVVAVGGG